MFPYPPTLIGGDTAIENKKKIFIYQWSNVTAE